MFDTTKEDLKVILRRVHDGKLQLPDFQRDYVWNDYDVRSLIASIAKGFPVGALLTLQTGGEVQFKNRRIAGSPETSVDPEGLLLDGQQRITSLYQSLFSQKAVHTKNDQEKAVQRFYYIDMEKAVEAGASLEEVIIGVPADRIVRTNFGRDIELDLSSAEKEFARKMFPLNKVFDNRNWMFDFRSFWNKKGVDTYELERSFDRDIIEVIDDYKMPIIQLPRDNSREAICLVFEKVNVGGKKLDAFELVTAIYAADKFDLRDDWLGVYTKPGRKARIAGIPNTRHLLTQLRSIDFLQACTILHTRELRLEKEAEGKTDKELPQVSCRRDALLALPLASYQKHSSNVESGFVRAASLLNELNLYWHHDVPYPPTIVTLASVFAAGGNRLDNLAAKQKLKQWFWCASLGELYGSSTESKIARDTVELLAWIIDGGPVPRTIEEAIFQKDRLETLRTRISAAYKALHVLLMSNGVQDFVTGKATDIMTFQNDKIDIHHIFPEHWCRSNGISPKVYDSIVNKSPLSAATNRSIGGVAPSIYLRRIQESQGISADELDKVLRTHLIEPEHLRNDDFEAFFVSRREALASIIKTAMGKAVIGVKDSNEPTEDLISDDELELFVSKDSG